MKEFNIYHDTKVVECKITLDCGEEFTGWSKCCPKDKFDVELGKKIANLRAALKIRKEYAKDLETQIEGIRGYLAELETEHRHVKKNMETIKHDIKKLSNR